MYYISKKPDLSVACKVRKLSDFKGNRFRPDGEEYYVRKSKRPHRIASIPVYVMAEGSLKKTNDKMWPALPEAFYMEAGDEY